VRESVRERERERANKVKEKQEKLAIHFSAFPLFTLRVKLEGNDKVFFFSFFFFGKKKKTCFHGNIIGQKHWKTIREVVTSLCLSVCLSLSLHEALSL
jgi:hypothetical protein